MQSIQKFVNRHGKIWLNVASSTGVLEDFVNLDNHIFLMLLKVVPVVCNLLPQKYEAMVEGYRRGLRQAVLLRHDCRKPLPFPDGSADHILCSHFLEHLYPIEAEAVIRDFHRVLKAKATMHIIVPDLAAQIQQYFRAKGSPSAADDFLEATILSRKTRPTLKYSLLEFSGAFGLQHRWMYDRGSMASRITKAGFALLERNDTPSRDYRLNDGSLHLIARNT